MAQLARIRQMSGQVSRGSAGEYQADPDHCEGLSQPLRLFSDPLEQPGSPPESRIT